jgi:hypothetical protein
MESNKQEESNLLNDNPIAAQAGGSWISKHMGGRVSPLQSKGSMAYQKDDTPLAKHTKAQGEKLNPGLVSAIHMHDDFTKKNNINHK